MHACGDALQVKAYYLQRKQGLLDASPSYEYVESVAVERLHDSCHMAVLCGKDGPSSWENCSEEAQMTKPHSREQRNSAAAVPEFPRSIALPARYLIRIGSCMAGITSLLIFKAREKEVNVLYLLLSRPSLKEAARL